MALSASTAQERLDEAVAAIAAAGGVVRAVQPLARPSNPSVVVAHWLDVVSPDRETAIAVQAVIDGLDVSTKGLVPWVDPTPVGGGGRAVRSSLVSDARLESAVGGALQLKAIGLDYGVTRGLGVDLAGRSLTMVAAWFSNGAVDSQYWRIAGMLHTALAGYSVSLEPTGNGEVPSKTRVRVQNETAAQQNELNLPTGRQAGRHAACFHLDASHTTTRLWVDDQSIVKPANPGQTGKFEMNRIEINSGPGTGRTEYRRVSAAVFFGGSVPSAAQARAAMATLLRFTPPPRVKSIFGGCVAALHLWRWQREVPARAGRPDAGVAEPADAGAVDVRGRQPGWRSGYPGPCCVGRAVDGVGGARRGVDEDDRTGVERSLPGRGWRSWVVASRDEAGPHLSGHPDGAYRNAIHVDLHVPLLSPGDVLSGRVGFVRRRAATVGGGAECGGDGGHGRVHDDDPAGRDGGVRPLLLGGHGRRRLPRPSRLVRHHDVDPAAGLVVPRPYLTLRGAA